MECWLPLQKTIKARKERKSDESLFVIMALMPCQVSFNMKKTTHSVSVYAKKKTEQEEGKEKKKERIRRESKGERSYFD